VRQAFVLQNVIYVVYWVATDKQYAAEHEDVEDCYKRKKIISRGPLPFRSQYSEKVEDE
jgi:hypothetical protein